MYIVTVEYKFCDDTTLNCGNLNIGKPPAKFQYFRISVLEKTVTRL